MTGEEKLDFLKSLIHCGYDISFREYDDSGRLIRADKENLIIDNLFDKSGCLKYVVENPFDAPLFLSSAFGLLWGAVKIEKHIHVIGPVLNTTILQDGLNESIRKVLPYIEPDFDFKAFLLSLPVIPMQMFHHYILMLNFALTEREMHIDDIQYPVIENGPDVPAKSSQKRNRHFTYMAEQELLYNVREGNMDSSRALSRASSLSTGVQIQTENPLSQAAITVIIFTSLCTREAIKGGLSPDTAYSVGDAYIQNMVKAKTISALSSLSHAMYIDFISRVRKARQDSRYSKTVQECCDYILTHMEDELSATILAGQLGYTPYYLSRRFRKETGMSLSDYIDSVRIEKAKALLLGTNDTISSIASLLHYCSSTYFSGIFRKRTGMLPNEYRKRQGNISEENRKS